MTFRKFDSRFDFGERLERLEYIVAGLHTIVTKVIDMEVERRKEELNALIKKRLQLSLKKPKPIKRNKKRVSGGGT